jgi:hypothetical protein
VHGARLDSIRFIRATKKPKQVRSFNKEKDSSHFAKNCSFPMRMRTTVMDRKELASLHL